MDTLPPASLEPESCPLTDENESDEGRRKSVLSRSASSNEHILTEPSTAAAPLTTPSALSSLDLIIQRKNGPDAEKHMEANGVFNERQAVNIMVDVLSMVCDLHGCGIGNLDVKPSIIKIYDDLDPLDKEKKSTRGMLVADHAHTVAYADARKLSDPVCKEPTGTPLYAAPEVSSSAPYAMDRADVWACGVTFFQLLSGSVPYRPLGADGGCAAVASVVRATGSIRNFYSGIDGSSCSKAPPCSLLCREVLGMLLELVPRNRPTPQQALSALMQLQQFLSASHTDTMQT